MNIAAAAVDQLARFNQTPAPMQQQQYQQNQPSRFDLDQANDDDFLSVKQARALMAQASQGDPVARQLAVGQNIRAIQKDEADAFRRWGPELHMEINKLPSELRTLDNLQVIVNMVRGNHYQELVDDQARQKAVLLANEQVATIRSGAGGSTALPTTQSFDLQSQELPQEWRDLATKQGLTMDAVREFVQATGDTMESYFNTVKKHGKGAVISG